VDIESDSGPITGYWHGPGADFDRLVGGRAVIRVYDIGGGLGGLPKWLST